MAKARSKSSCASSCVLGYLHAGEVAAGGGDIWVVRVKRLFVNSQSALESGCASSWASLLLSTLARLPQRWRRLDGSGQAPFRK
jgi:hypothetical protein